jgi:hypothetical protein
LIDESGLLVLAALVEGMDWVEGWGSRGGCKAMSDKLSLLDLLVVFFFGCRHGWIDEDGWLIVC